MKMCDVWNGNWGTFEIPRDVPRLFTVSGWFDARYKLTESLKRYFADMDERQRDGLPILSWRDWNDGI